MIVMAAAAYLSAHANFLITLLFSFLLQFTPIRKYTVTKDGLVDRWYAKHVRLSSEIHNGQPYEYFVGWPFVGYTTNSNFGRGGSTFTIVTTTTYYKYILECNDIAAGTHVELDEVTPTTELETKAVSLLCGSDINGHIVRRLHISFRPIGKQQDIISRIVQLYNQHTYAIVYIHGPPGTGKSMTSLPLAQHLGCSIFMGFNPTRQYESLDNIYTDISRRNDLVDLPVIVQIDEVDTIIDHAMTPQPPMNGTPPEVRTKKDWNHMLDTIGYGMYPKIIFVMTSNKSPAEAAQGDPSLFRSGRVHAVFEMTEAIDTMALGAPAAEPTDAQDKKND